MSLGNLVAGVGRRSSNSTDDAAVDIITFVESEWGLGLKLFPVQRIILKAHYGMELDDNPLGFPLDAPIPQNHPAYDEDLVDLDGYYIYRVVTTDFRRQNPQYHTEASYLKYLHSEGRCNIDRVVPGKQRREMVLSVGRRSGKTLITSCIVAYETYKLLLKGNPQAYYGSSQSNVIQLISVATDKDQAALLYREASGHFTKCDFFRPYAANATQSYATFQTPYDIEKYGSYADNPKARFSINVTFRSCVAKGLRGGANLLVALDEVAHFGDKGQASADEVYQAVEPSTRTFSKKDPKDKTKPVGENEGRIIMISSPLGKQGLFYKQFRLGFGDNAAADNLLCIQAPTWEVNPTVPAETFVGSYLKDPNVFDTEFGAIFSDQTRGWIQTPQDLYDCVIPELRPKLRAPPRAPHFMGVDIALVGDYSAIAIGHNDPDGNVVLDYIERIRAGEGDYVDYERLEFDHVADWVYDLSKRFYIVEGMFDQWAGIPFEQALNRRGLKNIKSKLFNPSFNSQVYTNFMHLMMDHKMRLYNWPLADDEEWCDYIQELLELQAEYKSKYIVNVEAPQMEGKHDDYSDALVRMVFCATQNKTYQHATLGASGRRGLPAVGKAPFGNSRRSARRSGVGSHSSRTVPRGRRR
jgi:hypothetical protein